MARGRCILLTEMTTRARRLLTEWCMLRVYLATADRLSARSMTADIDSSHTDSTTAAMIYRRCGLRICLVVTACRKLSHTAEEDKTLQM